MRHLVAKNRRLRTSYSHDTLVRSCSAITRKQTHSSTPTPMQPMTTSNMAIQCSFLVKIYRLFRADSLLFGRTMLSKDAAFLPNSNHLVWYTSAACSAIAGIRTGRARSSAHRKYLSCTCTGYRLARKSTCRGARGLWLI